MKKNAFTLIELLAVIVILAIIALIAVPIVIHIINDLKDSSDKESIKMYAKALEQATANYSIKHPNNKKITVEQLKEENLINYKGKEIICGTEKIYKSGKVHIKDCTINGNKVDYEYGEEAYKDYIHLVEDTGEEGLSLGDKYTYEVTDDDTFNFYVLSIEEDKVNLIMDRNICNDGTVEYASSNNYCRYAWYSGEKNNMYGPVTAIQELYEGTKEWNNVPTMELNYSDEFNRNKNNMGYISFIVTNGVGIITDKEKSSIVTIGTSNIPLKARLPKYSEATGAGCTKSNGTCPIWLMKNIAYYNVSDDKYSMNNNNESYQNIYGYWLLASLSGQTMYSCIVREYGRIHDRGTSSNNYVGIRPVITVPISDLK